MDLFYIDRYYIDYLRQFDTRVPFSNYTDFGRNEKFYIGVVLKNNGINYFAPISSKLQRNPSAINVYHNKKHLLSIEFAFMIPCIDESLLVKIDTKSSRHFSFYKRYITKKSTEISLKANNVYLEVTEKLSEKYVKNCLDFKLLETKMLTFEK